MAPSTKLPFAILNAFSSSLSGGNPAAVILTTPQEAASLTHEQCLTIARNLNQPMHMFITPKESNGFDVRWFTHFRESMLCGHATLAASGMLFNQDQDTGSKMFVPGVNASKALNFNGTANSLVGSMVDDGKLEISLNAAVVDELEREDPRAVKLRAAVAAACGADVGVLYLGAGTGSYKIYCLVELDIEDLGALKVDYAALKDTEFAMHVFTARPKSSARDAGIAFETRVFAPGVGINEDHVCGSAHGLLTPYWNAKLGSKGQTMRSHQVSARGGDLWVRLDAEKGLVHLAGYVAKVAEGTIFA